MQEKLYFVTLTNFILLTEISIKKIKPDITKLSQILNKGKKLAVPHM